MPGACETDRRRWRFEIGRRRHSQLPPDQAHTRVRGWELQQLDRPTGTSTSRSRWNALSRRTHDLPDLPGNALTDAVDRCGVLPAAHPSRPRPVRGSRASGPHPVGTNAEGVLSLDLQRSAISRNIRAICLLSGHSSTPEVIDPPSYPPPRRGAENAVPRSAPDLCRHHGLISHVPRGRRGAGKA